MGTVLNNPRHAGQPAQPPRQPLQPAQQPQPIQVQGPRPRIGAIGKIAGIRPAPKLIAPQEPQTPSPHIAPMIKPDRPGPGDKPMHGTGPDIWLNYEPTFGQTPSEIAKAYQQLQATPEDQQPAWLASQRDQITQAYNWFSFRNDGKPWTEWKYLDPTDPAHDFLMSIQGPPKLDQNGQVVNDQPFATIQQAQQGQANWTDVSPQDRQALLSDPNFDIAQYPSWQQQQILADPNFNWDKLPAWQRLYYSLSSNPAAMGAAQGLILGAGNPGGAVAGGVLGYAAAKSGYDQTKEFWQQDNKVAGAFGLFNWFAEQAEKGVGMGVQIAGILSGNTTIDPTKRNLNWDAGAVTFETLAPAYIAATGGGDGELNMRDFLSRLPVVALYDVAEMMINPEKYKGVELLLGRKDPLKLEETFYERIAEARKRIENGEDYRVVMTDFQNGVVAQMGDMVGQGVADPLNVFGETTSAVGEQIARVQGNEVAAAAFAGSSGITEAARRYQNLINNPAEALKIDPNFKISEIGWLGKTVAGLTSEGKVKAGLFNLSGDLLNNSKQKNKLTGAIDYLTSLTPESRARVGQDLLIRNLGGIMASYFGGTDVKGFAQWWKAFTNNDMTVAADLSNNLANSPEFYTVLPAAKDFNIDGMISAWDISETRRQDVTRLADILGENPMTLIDDLHKRGTAAEDFARIQERLKQAGTPEAQALLAEIAAGKYTEASLAEAVKVFGDGTVPFHPAQWMAMTLDAIKTHYDEWAVDHFKLDAESRKTLFRMSNVMKSAQSILLLGANPGYMISNVLPTMVTRAMSGVYGYMTPKAIDDFMGRMGFDPDQGFQPNRLEEGVGPSGLIDQATGRPAGSRDLIREATRGQGIFTKIEDTLGKIGRAMPFNKLSRLLEGYEGKQAFLIGIKKFWGEAWIREKGFRRIPADLAAELTRTVGPRATEILYSAIEAGMNKAELEAIVKGRSADVQSRTLITDAAKELNIPSAKAAKILEQVGILDALDAHLKGANNPGKVEAAFKRARQTAQEAIDIQAGRDNIARAEHIANRLNIEGTKALTDIVLDIETRGIEHWLQHYENMGAVADAADFIDNAATRSKMWSSAYAEDMATYRRYSAQRGSTYLGVLKAIGLDTSEAGMGWLATIADTDGTIDKAYTDMRNLRDGHFEQWNKDWNNPAQRAERTKIERQIEKIWTDATKREVDNLRRMGELLGQQYDQLFGVEAGEAARQAWDQITKFRQEMVKRRDDFRKSIEGVPNPERQIRSKEFWDGTYKYMIVEMSRIKQDAIARLDRIARGERGGDVSGAPATPNGPEPTGGGGVDSLRADYSRPFDEAMRNQAEISQRMETFTNRTNVPTVQEERAALRQQAAERQRIKDEKVSALWDIAEQYSKKLPNNSSNFYRGNFQDKPHLFNTLKNAEYGGDPSIKSWDDIIANITPEKAKQIFDAREAIKDESIKVFEAEQQVRFMDEMAKAKARAEARKAPENLTILQAIRKRGGIDTQSWINFNEKPEGYQPGVFVRNGKNRWALDQIARLLADDGYPINLDDPADIGGINQTIDLIKRARAGEDIYPVTHDYVIDAEVNKAQAEYLANETTTNEIDMPAWEADMAQAIESADHNRMINIWEQLPEDMANNIYQATGETYAKFFDRSYDEVTARIRAEEETRAIAENMARAEQAVKAQEAAAQTAMTRQRFRESLTEVFGLDDSEANAVMDITDARANAYGNPDEWYATRIAEVTKATGKVELSQSDVDYRIEDYLNQSREDLFSDVRDEYKTDWIRQAIKSFGLTDNLEEAGYILQDGRLLDFSGKNQGGTAGKRALDHRDITDAFHEDYNVQYGPIDDFNAVTGSIRHDFNNGDMNLDIFGTPTNSQLRVIQDAIDSGDVEKIYIDFSTQKGNVVTSVELSTDAGGEAIVAAIKKSAHSIFEGSTTPTQLHQFVDRVMGEVEGQLYQRADATTNPKGGVQFLDDGRAIIRAFDKADVSTVVHELGHIFRRDLKGTDLAIIEEWAGVKNGEWNVKAEEKFARGFEKYLADGEAPTPKLRRVFEQFKQWMAKIYQAITGSPIDIELTPQVREVFGNLLDTTNKPNDVISKSQVEAKIKEINKANTQPIAQQAMSNPLYQADPRMPMGGYEQSAGWIPNSDVIDEGWTKEIQPLLDKMQEGAIRKLAEPTMDGAYRDLSPEGQRLMNQYMNGVKQDMASTKLAAQRWGAEQRDFTMLNYNKRYGLHQMLDQGLPYEFFYTASMMTWAMRAIDNPAILSNYARLRMQQDRYENNLPERLRGKIRIEAPYLPDWMGDAVYIDPLSVLFTPHNFLRPYEQMVKDTNMQQIEADRILQEWAADGTVPLDQLQQAAQTKTGTVYERALAEAKIRREAEISNPLDFVATMLGPAWYLTTPYKLATGKGKEISELPLTRTARAVDTVTQGTWAEPAGDILGLLAKPEEKAREVLNLPAMGEYGDYYTDRNIANMVAEGKVSPEEAQTAMIERSGPIFEEALQRTKMELAMRVPLAGTIYAGLNQGPAGAAQAFLPSLFGAGLLPEGELKYRGLKDEWNAAWKLKDAGDDTAITKFFDDHPEYEVYLAKGKPPEERLRSFLIGQIWDGYMSLGDTDRKQASAAMGDLFRNAFLNSETRSYDTLDVNTLSTWAQMLNKTIPNTPETAPAIGNAPQIPYYPKEVTDITDRFFQERKQLYPNYFMLEQGYYSLPPSGRAAYLLKFPQLQAYQNWRDGYYERFPELKPIFKGQVFKQIDTSSWPMGLEGYVTDYAYTGKKLPSAAKKALEQVWLREGMPMGDLDTWLQSQVVPALLYQQGAPMAP